MNSLCKLFRRHKDFEDKFQQLRAHSYTTNAKFKDRQSRTQYKEANIDTELPIWSEDSI